jgi:hypothetical protein
MNVSLRLFLVFPVVALSGCLSYSSRVELRASDSSTLVKESADIRREVDAALIADGFKLDSEENVSKLRQYYPNLVAGWSRLGPSSFLMGTKFVQVRLEVAPDLVLVLVQSGKNQGNEEGVATTSALLKRVLAEKFPMLQIKVESWGYINNA